MKIAYQRIAYWKIRAPDAVGEPAEREAAHERSGESGAVDQALPRAVQIPDPREDRRDEADQQDLHGDERPGQARHDNRPAVEARQAAAAEDVLDVDARRDGG